ncbi:hypothetical protein [Burkholderia cepacia]|uniref:hypothetical protein n=1 Tax=Burkholderia cepacia TaxID=292 RepID=UPI00075664F9|nr:hypothetical protein [Burkholderia cepacia]KAB1594794.1 hypothetical protein C5O75_005915 [Burkholderia cepacia]KVF60372.1 hypothetical protein WJ15_02315 [Burkholderia cepacia]KVS71476.1 hypothetical protein WK41_15850 [Burkholderia cepacia]KWO12810.1 hypothetical protein WM26_11665 [Burkholderia cepacia]MDW9245679.1 hypothetical protein [Burkholderia cepacia]
MKRLSRLAIAALLAAAVAPAFARGMPQLPDDDGGRASVLQALNPARAADAGRPHAAGVVPNRGGETPRGRDSGIDRRLGVAGDDDAR